jgi:hypothetical protein
MHKNKTHYILKAVFLTGALLGTTAAFADPNCNGGAKLMTLASNVTEGLEAGTPPTANTTVCVDTPANLMSNHMVFNIDTPATSNGTESGTPVALKHMYLMAAANIARVKGWNLHHPDGPYLSLSDFSIIGIIHGSALKWALNDAWWQAQVDVAGRQLYPDGNPNRQWFDKLAALQAKGMDVHLEVCAVSLRGAGLSNTVVHTDVDPNVLVTQGAFGRMSSLAQQGYAIVQEGWVDNDDKHAQ